MNTSGAIGRKLEVGIECRIEDFRQGIGTALMALARTLCRLPSDAERYTFFIFEDDLPVFRELVGDRARLLCFSKPAFSPIKNALRWITPLRTGWGLYRASMKTVAHSDGTAEANHLDVIHFPTQIAYRTEIPSIYHPWDLQHLHFPEFFTKADRISRERNYRAFCAQARFVSVLTQWGKDDLIRHYGINEDKVAVIPWGSVLSAYKPLDPEESARHAQALSLPAQFVFYPAATWPHKNHELLIRALAHLNSHARPVSAICTGMKTKEIEKLMQMAETCGVSSLIRFLGFVSPAELQCIYQSATAMVYPSLFEGFGLPILEAFQSDLPVLCSDATVLPEVAGGAALLFNPRNPEGLSDDIFKITSSPDLRRELVSRGRRRLAALSMQDTAERFRKLYWSAAGRSF